MKGDVSGDDIDILRSELQDRQESVDSKKEENNYDNLGVDNRNNQGGDKIKKTMKIQINTDKSISGDERQQDYFSTIIAEGLKRFQSHITRIEVHLSDENGKKEGLNNMLCKLEARIEGMQPIAVSCQVDTVELAVNGAIDKLKNSLETILGRMQNH